MSNFSLPRARRAAEGRLLAILRIRLISAATRRLTRIWLALTDTTSAETTEISEVRRVSTSLMWEVTWVRPEVKLLRSWFTWDLAWARAAPRSLTVLAKRASARAACLARESLRELVEAASMESARARLEASFWYTLLNLSLECFSARATSRRRVFRVRDMRMRSFALKLLRAVAARFCSAEILLRMEVEVAFSLAAVLRASLAMRAA